MRRMALAVGLVLWNTGVARAETVNIAIGSMADQMRVGSRVHVGSLSAGIGALSRVADDSRVLHLEGVTAGVGAELGAFAIGVDWVNFGEHTVERFVGGLIAADTVVIPPQRVLVHADYPTQGFLLTARFQRPPFSLEVRTVTRSSADRGSLLPGQAVAQWELGRTALLAGIGRPAQGRLGYEPHAFAGFSLSLGPRVRSSASPEGSFGVPAAPAFHAFRSGGLVRIEIEGLQAGRVEVASDASAWEPVALAPAGANRWEGTIVAGPGTIRILMRIDGAAWQPPPGLPVAHEPATGDVGILVLEE